MGAGVGFSKSHGALTRIDSKGINSGGPKGARGGKKTLCDSWSNQIRTEYTDDQYIDSTGDNFIKPISRKYCLAIFFAKQKLCGTPVTKK